MWRTCTLMILGLLCTGTCAAADEIDETLKEYRELIVKPARERNIDEKTSLLRIGDRIYRWAKKNPSDERSTEALLVLCEERPLGAQASGAIGLLLERSPQAPQWAELCLAIAETEWSNADSILTQLAKESSHAVVRGAAHWGLAQRRLAEAVEIDPLEVAKVTAAQQKAIQHLKALSAISEPVRIEDEFDLRDLAKAKTKDMESIALGIRAPEVTGTGLDGETLALTSFRGKVVVMIFWGAWCPICREQFPAEKELAKKFADKPVALLGVNSDSELEIAAKLAKEEGLSWPSYFDEGTTRGPIARQWAIEFWPTVILLDHRGVIRYRFKGMKKVDEAVEILLKEV
jgi:peroxiredoxin